MFKSNNRSFFIRCAILEKYTDRSVIMKKLPVLYESKEDCCGCTACYAICPKEAITMVPDEEGFDYPQVDSEKCVSCYMCMKVCPIKKVRKSL